MTMATMEEKVYRQIVDDVFARIDAAFEPVDPDLAESMYAQGTLTVVFAGGKKLIVSPQPPVRQIWVAFKDRAWHFDRDADGRWMDDRGQGLELFALCEQLTKETAGVAVSIRR